MLETVVAMLIMLSGAAAMLPAFTQEIITGDLLWERRLAMGVIETQLDAACQAAQTDFAGLVSVNDVRTGIPTQLANGRWTRTVSFFNGITTLKQVQVTVRWISRGRDLDLQSAAYLISQTGLCGG